MADERKMADLITTFVPFKKNQVWSELRPKYNRQSLFYDSFFPPNETSLNNHGSKLPCMAPGSSIVWRRASEIIKDPKFVVNDSETCGALDQGLMKDSWFIATIICLRRFPTFFAKVVPKDQGFGDDYGGIFHFQFWYCGQWLDVVVDDYLPFDENSNFIFCHDKKHPNELWSALLEKAYAKFYGSYETLNSGNGNECMIDLSGGISESWNLKKMTQSEKDNFWTILFQAFKKCSISIFSDSDGRNGLVKNHTYSLVNMVPLSLNSSIIYLLKLRNPLVVMDSGQWDGAWSLYSTEWKSLSDEIKKENGLTVDAYGEFWISFNDFMLHFGNVETVHLTLDSFSVGELEPSTPHWFCKAFNSRWQSGMFKLNNAGGAGKNFWQNPQFLIAVTNADQNSADNLCTIIIDLMQEDPRLTKNEKEANYESIMWAVFKLHDFVIPQIYQHIASNMRFYSNQLDLITTSILSSSREVTGRIRVPPGSYVVIPCTDVDGINRKFMLRIFTENPTTSCEMINHKHSLIDEEKGIAFEIPTKKQKQVCGMM